jgi:putative ABC transport system substrate-binding protein
MLGQLSPIADMPWYTLSQLSLGVCLHALAKAGELGLSNCNAGGLVIGSDAFFASRSAKIAALSLRHAMPSVSEFREFPAIGGLRSYGGRNADVFRLVGSATTGRILRARSPQVCWCSGAACAI